MKEKPASRRVVERTHRDPFITPPRGRPRDIPRDARTQRQLLCVPLSTSLAGLFGWALGSGVLQERQVFFGRG